MRALVLLLGLIAAGCVGTPIQHEYSGADAGAIVFSMENIGGPEAFTFEYRELGRKSRPGLGSSSFGINPGSILDRKVDFSGAETGWVVVRYLKPGTYEIYQYTLFDTVGGIDVQEVNGTYFAVPAADSIAVNAPQDFSLRFTVEPGRATYLGSFATLQPGGSNALLGILDRHERDLTIARKADPRLPPVTIGIPDLTHTNIPRLQAGDPLRPVD